MGFTPAVAASRAGVAAPAFTASSWSLLSTPTFAGRKSMSPFLHFSSPPPPANRLLARAQRATWLPGLDPPPHLDGTLAGDFGFDPLGLGEDRESLKWYVQAELIHCRFAMAGVAGILVTDVCN
ncbi:putative photosystem I chlorophyll a/b-binding protein 5, chloroplastic [Cocos nucifera]|uniref:Chlorophyll a-b binding protein, chloroplastic n=1 Tax=Cocos nucifera TaxID=13894 RepID=A0A8K0ITD6_COCNU|nr:putative photosystem I chlorophyll a/b-binding protein 5, chloroplastic [Cocos nucifera]